VAAKYTLKLPAEVAGEIHWGAPQPVEHDGFVFEQEAWEHYDESRWSQIHKFVIVRWDALEGRTYWQALIEQGSTENQPNNDFCDEEFIEFVQVDKIPTVTYTYQVIR
jgi:hypothetical protein